MEATKDRIKRLRTDLHLSQEYVANYLGINRVSFTQIENGNRNLNSEEVVKLVDLFGVSADYLLRGDEYYTPNIAFARSFENLDDNDKAEIMNLIRFKEQIKSKK